MDDSYNFNNLLGRKNYGDINDGLVQREVARRKERKLTQKQLAEKSGVSYASLRRFETTGEIELHSLILLMFALGDEAELETLFSHHLYSSLEDMK
jgi:transcriptional regulator with XRE-family HTH domain